MTDAYRWLEDVDSPRSLAWVRDRNAETAAAFPDLAPLSGELRTILDAPGRIPYPTWQGDHFYNLWQDAANPRGLWRRTPTLSPPAWEVLLDLDALAEAEGESWVWAGATFRRPSHDLALVALSRGGADAVVIREFDLVRVAFVDDGFVLPEAKSSVSWVDRDTLFVCTDVGPGSTTTSGYPRVAKRWRRGTPLSAAETVFEGQPDDVSVRVFHDATPGYERDVAKRWLDIFRNEAYLLRGDGPVRIDIPDDADWDVRRSWLVLRLRSPWQGHPAGALLAAAFDDVVAGAPSWTVLFTPDAHTSLVGTAWTADRLLLTVLDDVRARVTALTPAPGEWQSAPVDVGGAHVEDVVTDPDASADFLALTSDFLVPDTLLRVWATGATEVLWREPAHFPADALTMRQFFATSADGTQVPYFVVGDPSAAAPPTLMTAYGGFEIPLTPSYQAMVGHGWLARGGTYVVANIRGGGEYGPAWHRAARRENRPRAFEDCAAVAADLVARGITTADRLGFEGASNGGLLAGVMLTRYPELFGAVVVRVPLLDMLRFHHLLAGPSWMAEYGDPEVAEDRAFIADYSPYLRIDPARRYPPALVTTSTRDDRVHPGHARKMAAALRAAGHDVTYYENVEGGHGAAADNAQRAHLWALVTEFLHRHLAAGAGVPAATSAVET